MGYKLMNAKVQRLNVSQKTGKVRFYFPYLATVVYHGDGDFDVIPNFTGVAENLRWYEFVICSGPREEFKGAYEHFKKVVEAEREFMEAKQKLAHLS